MSSLCRIPGAGIFIAGLGMATGILFSAGIVSAQTGPGEVEAVIEEQAQLDQAARSSQQQIAVLDQQADQLLAEYRQVYAEARSLEDYNDQMDDMVGSQMEEIESIDRQSEEIETTAREVIPLMQKMLVTLEQFVELDIPFLLEERKARIESLKEIMSRADVTTSEKYRRILEAYNVEMEYGRTIEAYRSELQTSSELITVDFLRLGRITLMYQSLNGEQTGYWDHTRESWIVNNDYQRSVRQGLRIAKQQSAPDLIIAPVRSPQEN